MGPFEKPVDLAAFRDYTQIIETPIDLQTVERNVKIAFYKSPEDFEYDFLLIFQNCIAYNSARKTDHLVAMGKYGMKSFKRIFAARMKAFDDPTAVPSSSTSPESIRKAPPDGGAQQGPPKKIKLDPGVSRGKTGPRISLTSTKLSVAAEKAPQIPPRSKSPKPTQAVPKTSMPKTNPNVPVPLHIAIAQIKEQFPSRRAVKTLTGWEAGCARFFKEMMRHSWISAARPKFMFHIPVPVLFPVSLRGAHFE